MHIMYVTYIMYVIIGRLETEIKWNSSDNLY
jgi:hypothetical protein